MSQPVFIVIAAIFLPTLICLSSRRFIAGLGCGGLMPNAVALMNEYSPRRSRGTLAALMFSGYSLGGMLSAGLGIYILPKFGWQAMFFSAVVPLLLLPILLWKLPESVGFLLKQGKVEQARQMLKKANPLEQLDGVELFQEDTKVSSEPALDLFKEGRLIGTQILLYANAAQYYPLSMRSSGLGWASGIGRTGAIAGPFLGGTLMAMALPLKLNFYAFALPGVISALAIVVLILSVQHQAAIRRTVVAA